MELRSIAVGPLEVNCYIVVDPKSRSAIVIDPGDEPDRIEETVKAMGATVVGLVCTHTHFDHVGAIPELREHTKAQVLIHEKEKEIYDAAKDMAAFWGFELAPLPEPDGYLVEDDTVAVGDLAFKVIHTPGHSPGGICLAGHGVVFTGDTLFTGSIGRTDFPGGDYQTLIDSLGKLAGLPESTVVYPGHGPQSTIGEEKRENPYMSGALAG